MLSDGQETTLMIVKGKANINMLHKIKTKQLVRQMALRFCNFGMDVDCLRINASSSVELVMDVSEEQTDLLFIILILEMFLESHITFSLTTRCHLFLFIHQNLPTIPNVDYTGLLYAETINIDDLPQTPDKKRLSEKGIVTKVNK